MNDHINNNGYYGEYCTPVDAVLDDAALNSAAFNNTAAPVNEPAEFTRWWDINLTHSLYDIIHNTDEFSISSDDSSDDGNSTNDTTNAGNDTLIITPIKYDNGIDPATNTNMAHGTDKYDVVTFYSRGKAIYGMTTALGVSPSAYNLYRWKKGLDAIYGDAN